MQANLYLFQSLYPTWKICYLESLCFEAGINPEADPAAGFECRMMKVKVKKGFKSAFGFLECLRSLLDHADSELFGFMLAEGKILAAGAKQGMSWALQRATTGPDLSQQETSRCLSLLGGE